jgi:formyl-CoA transferase
MEKRLANRDDLEALVEPLLRARPSNDWLREFEAAGVPAGPVNSIDQVFGDEQVAHLEMTRQVNHPTRGSIDLVRSPLTFSGSSDHVEQPAPSRGQHTDEILAEYLFSPEEIKSLRQDEVVL